jgi:GNAT superfamily N-acetyltransferase
MNGTPVLAPAMHETPPVSKGELPHISEGAKLPVIRVAETDEDVVAIHAFLCRVATDSGALQATIDPEDSINEVWRVVHHECALMAIIGDRLVGTLGLIQVPWWYNKGHYFLTDRWFFVLPEHRNGVIGKALLADAAVVAEASDLPPPIINLKQRRKDATGGPNVTYMRAQRPDALPL